MTRLALLFTVSLAALGAFGADTYVVDPAHTFAGFTVRHLLVSKAQGRFSDIAGTVTYDADLSKCGVNVTIKAASIDTDNEGRDRHLRSADFFDVEKYPAITFVSKSVAKSGGKDAYVVTGDLTMHGVTRTIAIPFTFHGPIADPLPAGTKRLGAEGSLKLNRKDYGVAWNRLMDNGGAFVADEVEIALSLEAYIPKGQ